MLKKASDGEHSLLIQINSKEKPSVFPKAIKLKENTKPPPQNELELFDCVLLVV